MLNGIAAVLIALLARVRCALNLQYCIMADSQSAPQPSEEQLVLEARAADFLLDARRRAFLAPFMQRELSVSAAARELAVNANTMLYRVREMFRMGLLVVARIQPRAGRAVQLYRSSARSFFVPFHATSFESVENQRAAIDAPLQALLARSVAKVMTDARCWGTWIGYDPQFGFSALTRRDPAAPDAPQPADTLSLWATLRLTPDDAQAVLEELRSVLSRAHARQDERGQQYLLRLGFVRVEDSLG
jgi:hypothetical protein